MKLFYEPCLSKTPIIKIRSTDEIHKEQYHPSQTENPKIADKFHSSATAV